MNFQSAHLASVEALSITKMVQAMLTAVLIFQALLTASANPVDQYVLGQDGNGVSNIRHKYAFLKHTSSWLPEIS